MLLFAPPEVLREAVVRCCRRAGRRGHILNVGHGVVQVRSSLGSTSTAWVVVV